MSAEILRETAKPGRLDQFWAQCLAGRSVTRAKVQEWIKSGLATVDASVVTKPSHKLRGGEALVLAVPEARASACPEEGGLEVVYRDSHLAVVDKEPGLTVHPAPSCPGGTLVNRLLHRFPGLARLEGERPGIVHRIDKDTSGLLVVALSEDARLKLSAAFAGREVKKTYLALVHGVPARAEGSVDAPIARDPSHKTRMAVVKGGRESLSFYRVAWSAPDGRASLLEVDIATGRTHQIRVHMSHLGHPLLGDVLYGPARHAELKRERPLAAKLASRQMLHAWKIAFSHPATGLEMAFELPPPKDFWRLPLELCRVTQRVGVVGLPGAGKSVVMGELARRGWPVFSADACVAELYEPGADGWHMLRSRHGGRFVPDADRPVDKKALFAAMRESEAFRRELMELLYPMVLHRLEEFWRENARSRAAFAEVPMLLEAGWLAGGAVDMAVGVSCPENVRHERLAKKRGWDRETIALMDSWQWPGDKKMAACSHVVDNSGPLGGTLTKVGVLLDALRRERTGRASSLLAWMRSKGYA
ncbi:MAG: dephospho-CoA kinase [Thermodesulfobacteriota bacterium]